MGLIIYPSISQCFQYKVLKKEDFFQKQLYNEQQSTVQNRFSYVATEHIQYINNHSTLLESLWMRGTADLASLSV